MENKRIAARNVFHVEANGKQTKKEINATANKMKMNEIFDDKTFAHSLFSNAKTAGNIIFCHCAKHMENSLVQGKLSVRNKGRWALALGRGNDDVLKHQGEIHDVLPEMSFHRIFTEFMSVRARIHKQREL